MAESNLPQKRYHLRVLIGAYLEKPMVCNKPLIRPYVLRGYLGGGRFTGHEFLMEYEVPSDFFPLNSETPS